MGMFDYIICDYPLEDKEVQNEHFQTKSFGNHFNIFRITTDGKFQIEQFHNSLLEKDAFVRLNCSFRFYTSSGNRAHNTYKWYEYEANFKNGNLIDIITIKNE